MNVKKTKSSKKIVLKITMSVTDLGEIPINQYLSQLFLKPREIPNDSREIPILLSYQICPRIATNHFPETQRNPQ